MAARMILLVLLGLFPFCISQASHTVQVTNGFYIPPTTSALQGDTVTFIFTGKNHSVTQSTFDSPCNILQGGFDSDSWGVATPGDPIPQWTITITNDSQPIWFYCKNILPQFHCSAGMVGAINPPTGTSQNFSAFLQAAKAVQSTPAVTPGAILTGIGASASSVPTLVANTSAVAATSSPPIPSSSSSSESSSSSSAGPTSPVLSPQNSSPSAAVVGGAVGGSLGGVIIIGIIFSIWFFGFRDPPSPRSTRSVASDGDLVFANPRPRPGRMQQLSQNTRMSSAYEGGANGSTEWRPEHRDSRYTAVSGASQPQRAWENNSGRDSPHSQLPPGAASAQSPLAKMSSANIVQLASELATIMNESSSSKNGANRKVTPPSGLPAIHEQEGGSTYKSRPDLNASESSYRSQ